MRIGTKILQRFFASGRPNSTTKNSKVELNFKENNHTPDPYDIIDHNVPGMEQRLRLYEMLRLKEQLVLDKRELESFKLMNYSANREIFTGITAFDLSYNVTSGFPGINCPTQSSSDSNVTIDLDFDGSKLTKDEKNKIIKLFKLNKYANNLEFTVSEFPLVSQNKTRALSVLKSLISFVRNQDLDPVKTNLEITDSTEAVNGTKGKSKSTKKTFEFPAEWLQAKAE